MTEEASQVSKPLSLSDMIEVPEDRPIIATICGDSGLGKTSLAATFPNPIFIRVEDGLQAIPMDRRPAALPIIKTADDLWQQGRMLLQEDHNYETLVIDSVTVLDLIFTQHVIDTDPKCPRSINQALGGYGAGTSAVAVMHNRVRKLCGLLNSKRNMHIVFVAHADTETIELPDEDPYTRYSLRLGKKSVAAYVDQSDLVGFLKLQTFTTGDGDRKKAVSDGSRQLITYATAANVSKNRYEINKPIEVKIGENPLTQYIPSLNQGNK